MPQPVSRTDSRTYSPGWQPSCAAQNASSSRAGAVSMVTRARRVDRVPGVDAEVHHYLVELRRVDLHTPEVIPWVPDQLDVRSHQPAQHREHGVHGGVELDRPWSDHLLAREAEQLLRDTRRSLCRFADLLEIGIHRFARVQLPQGQLHIAEDHAQRVVEVVRDSSGQPPYRFHLLALAELFLAGAERLFAELALGDVAEYQQASHVGTVPLVMAGHR